MNPAEIYAELRLLKHAIDTATRQAEHDAMEYAEQTRSKTLETDRGLVSLCRRKPSISLNERAFFEWVKANHPTEIEESVRPAYAEAFRKGLRVAHSDDGRTDVLTSDGEVLDFASVGEPVVYLSAKIPADEKDRAVTYVANHLDQLIVREVTSGE